jgi:hypothetical protein
MIALKVIILVLVGLAVILGVTLFRTRPVKANENETTFSGYLELHSGWDNTPTEFHPHESMTEFQDTQPDTVRQDAA